MTKYTASRTRDPGRGRYSVIFRHPVRLDTSGRPGRRVRRGLGTSDEGEADRLVAQLNVLLGNEEFWAYSARGTAGGRFDPRVVAAFYEGMQPEGEQTSRARRDGLIPLPGTDQGYRRVLLLGTTGAGKTTLVRQLLGTDPKRDRFPSTSTAKTTVADTEIVIREDGPYAAAVTFFPRDEVVDHLADCASKAALAALRGVSDADMRVLLLDHENQRFRFSYVLGRRRRPDAATDSLESDDDASFAGYLDDLADLDALDDFGTETNGADDGDDAFEAEPEGLAGIDLDATAAVVDAALATLRVLVAEHADAAKRELSVTSADDERVAAEILDEELDKMLRSDERFNGVVDTLLDEIETRFDALVVGVVTRDRQGWPATWTWQSDDRDAFLRAVNRFSSNYAPMFGHLLSPLVSGLRVAGPFRPAWHAGPSPRLVLIDGEGLGHTPKSSAALPTAVVKVIEEIDAVLLVDNAKQPMQAAPISAIRSMLTAGSSDKIIFCFTHFDAVTGDNLGNTPSSRARHVLESAENLLSSIRDEFNPRSERALRRRLERNRVFLGGLDKPLDPRTPEGRQAVQQLVRLLDLIDRVNDRPELGGARPEYDKTNLVLAVAGAATAFHRRWKALLGVAPVPDVEREHWTRVRALNRRFAEGTADQYDTLRPAADLREFLKDEIYKTLENPLRWEGGRPDDDVQVTAVINEFSQAIAKRLTGAISERLSIRPQRSWQEAYALSGTGSTFVRARRISDEILGANVPMPGSVPSPDQNDFLHSVIAVVEDAAAEVGCKLK